MKRTSAALILLWSTLGAFASTTFDKATITYLQNDVAVADVKLMSLGDGQTKKTAATLNQAVTRDNAVITGDKSRVEMKFNDGSVVRLGQYSVFSFKEGTRDLNLKQGSVLMNVPKGMGRTNVRAASVTAAITGTTVLFQAYEGYTAIYVYEGTVTIPPNYVLGPGQALIFENGTFRLERFDVQQAIRSGALFTRFVESPNNRPFTVDEILEKIKTEGGPGTEPPDTDNVDAVLNKDKDKEPPKDNYNNQQFLIQGQ